jgi:hypothetical protein
VTKRPVFRSKVHEANWLSEFMGMDIDRISDSKEAMLKLEYMYLLYGEEKLGRPFEAKGGVIGRQFRFLTFAQSSREALKVAQGIARKTIKGVAALRDSKTDELKLLPVPYKTYVEDNIIWQDTENEKALLQQSIINLLCHFPADTIKPCANEYCKNFFVHATEREKIYCSRRCAWQQTAKDIKNGLPVTRTGKKRKVTKKSKTKGGE